MTEQLTTQSPVTHRPGLAEVRHNLGRVAQLLTQSDTMMVDRHELTIFSEIYKGARILNASRALHIWILYHPKMTRTRDYQ